MQVIRIVALASLTAVIYGALVWSGNLSNLFDWHYYPKVFMLVGSVGLLISLESARSRQKRCQK